MLVVAVVAEVEYHLLGQVAQVVHL